MNRGDAEALRKPCKNPWPRRSQDMRGVILVFLLLSSYAMAQLPERKIVVRKRVAPQYPMIAKQARITGTVVIRYVSNGDKRLDEYQVVSGHPMLVAGAIEAIKQWEIMCEECVYPEPFEKVITISYTMK